MIRRIFKFHRPSLYASVLGFVGLICLSLIGVQLLQVWQTRVSELRETEIDTTNLARSLAQQAEDTFQIADTILLGLKERVQTEELDAAQVKKIHERLTLWRKTLPLIHGIFVVDAHGTPLISSVDYLSPGINYSDREYFKYQASRRDDGLLISDPVRSKADGSWIIVLSRKVMKPDGSFNGLVMITISASFFQRLYDTVDVGQHGVILLGKDPDTVLVRKPFVEANVGRHWSLSPQIRDLASQLPTSNFEYVSSFDSVRRLASYRRLQNYPIFVVVAHAKADALAGWRREAGIQMIVVFAITLILAFLGHRLAAQIRARQETETLYRLLADHSSDAIVCAAMNGTRRYLSPAFSAMTGTSPKDLLSQSWISSCHPDDREMVATKLKSLRKGESQVCVTYRQIRDDGSYFWAEAQVQLVPGHKSGTKEVIANIRDITERKAVEEQLAAANVKLMALSITDALTEIANRRKFDEVIETEWNRAMRDGAPLSLLLLDVDCFKKYNDTYGHQQGDLCLRAIAKAIDSAVNRTSDLVARYGGEEFAVVLPKVCSEGALIIGERIRSAISALGLEHLGNPAGIVTVSGGIAALTPSRDALSTSLVQFADQALYRAKDQGRNRMMLADTTHLIQSAA